MEEPDEDDIERVGTLAKVVQFFRLPDGTVKALVEGQIAGRHRVVRLGLAASSACTTACWRPGGPGTGRASGR